MGGVSEGLQKGALRVGARPGRQLQQRHCLAQVCRDGDAPPLCEPRTQHLGSRSPGAVATSLEPSSASQYWQPDTCLALMLMTMGSALYLEMLRASYAAVHVVRSSECAAAPASGGSAVVQVHPHGGNAGQCGSGAADLRALDDVGA